MRHAFAAIVIAALLSVTGAAAEPVYTEEERSHWAFQPREVVTVPVAHDSEWAALVHTPVDAFILARVESAQLRPAPEADRATLIRRVTYSLTGLPPTPDDVAEFVNDPRPDAYERLVDRLLASPRFGEQSGQHWLDVVRYAETEGFEYDRHRPGAWRYRDYVIDAMNDDKPYDRFVFEQLAGDELDADDPTLLAAAGFHRLGTVRRNAGNPEVAFSRNEVLTERTDIIGTALLAMTVGCARCHDHMYDAIRQRDYYQLQAFLGESYEYNRVLASEAEQAEWEAQTKLVQDEIDRIKQAITKVDGDEEKQLRRQLLTVEGKLPKPLATVSTVRNVRDDGARIHLLTRGDPDLKADPVSPRVLGVLLPEGAAALAADLPQPRTELARWIASPNHPLTARVIVNRIWRAHFGTGLVATPNDFGTNGQQPSHPRLLDYLANQLIENGWRLKPIHRSILLSSSFRQSSMPVDPEQVARVDPDNRLVSHFSRRRLTAEELRDSMLQVSGQFHEQLHGPSIMVPVDQELIDLLYKPTQWEVSPQRSDHHRRSIYLIAKRNLRLPILEVFDQPDLQTSCAVRESSTHAPQALALLNGDFANQLADAFARRLQTLAPDNVSRQIELAFELIGGRSPTEQERHASQAFLATQPPSEFALAMFNLNAFLYID